MINDKKQTVKCPYGLEYGQKIERYLPCSALLRTEFLTRLSNSCLKKRPHSLSIIMMEFTMIPGIFFRCDGFEFRVF